MNPEPSSPVRQYSSVEDIAGVVRAEIWQGKLKSGQPLRQDELAARFGVSKIPVREALIQLKAEGLVVFFQNRGAVVSEMSAQELEETYILRAALESTALQRALPKLTIADLQNAEETLSALDAEQDVTRWSELNWQFHAILYTPARLPRLMEWIRTLHYHSARYLILYLAGLDFQSTSQKEHREILTACRMGNIQAAAELLRQHLESASVQLVSHLNSHKNQEGT